ncbi:MAG: fibrobacter succinogenes major paralogous domain-containing protein, partial [Mariniphaga sp.]
TATTGDVTPGYYYNSGTSGSPVWTKLLTTTGTHLGDMQYWNGTTWVMVAVGQPGQFLRLSPSGIPAWTNSTVSDIDGNVYNTVTIGTQTWMAENLRTTKYRNGDAIPNDNGNWLPLVTGAYSWLNFDVANKAVYGGFYNWYAVADSRNIAPVGWHVPTDAEWSTLITYLGGESVAGGKLKEAGTTHWYNPNTGATNESGFTALGGGFRYGGGSFTLFMKTCFWWSSTEFSTTDARTRYMNYEIGSIPTSENTKHYGFCVRCIRD